VAGSTSQMTLNGAFDTRGQRTPPGLAATLYAGSCHHLVTALWPKCELFLRERSIAAVEPRPCAIGPEPGQARRPSERSTG